MQWTVSVSIGLKSSVVLMLGVWHDFRAALKELQDEHWAAMRWGR